jgi:hypothetical protein
MTDSTGSRREPDPDEVPFETSVPTDPPVRTPAAESGAFAEGLAAAARRAGFAPPAAGEAISGHALLAAMGGIRGLVEAVLPGLVFLATYTVTRQLVPALIAPIAIGLIFAGLRAAAKQTVTQAVGGLVGIGISAVLALFTGRAEDFYLPGFWTNAGYGAALLISIAVGWPLIGLAVGFLMGDGIAWRSDPSRRRVLTILTGCWAAMFVLRLAVQLPLYYSGNVEWLGATKLLMGIPLYAPLLVLSWLMVRSVYPAHGPATDAAAPGPRSPTGDPEL